MKVINLFYALIFIAGKRLDYEFVMSNSEEISRKYS